LQAALAELPEVYRTPLILFYFEEFSYKEIARQMGTPVGTVMSRLARAKSFLRRRLTRTPAAIPS
jgi:RNA polymerase sigma-70 factor (ECF subfamily)